MLSIMSFFQVFRISTFFPDCDIFFSECDFFMTRTLCPYCEIYQIKYFLYASCIIGYVQLLLFLVHRSQTSTSVTNVHNCIFRINGYYLYFSFSLFFYWFSLSGNLNTSILLQFMFICILCAFGAFVIFSYILIFINIWIYDIWKHCYYFLIILIGLQVLTLEKYLLIFSLYIELLNLLS